MTERRYSVYIMASRRNGTLYVGVTNHLAARAFQHRNGHGSEFTSKYAVTRLVWYEHHVDVNEAIAREKQLKKRERRWKLDLIESTIPTGPTFTRRSTAECHPRESGGPESRRRASWMPACAGMTVSTFVTPAKAGVQGRRRRPRSWPAHSGMTPHFTARGSGKVHDPSRISARGR